MVSVCIAADETSALQATRLSADAIGVTILRACLVCLLSLPFLNPVHAWPLPTFIEDALAVALGLAMALAALMTWRSGTRLPGAFVIFLTLGLYVHVQRNFIEAPYPQVPMLWTAVFAWAALVAWVGAVARQRFGLEPTIKLSCAVIALTSATSALVGILQIYAAGEFSPWLILPFDGTRAYGNISQSNLFASQLCIGLAALAFLYGRSSMVPFFAWGACGLICWGIALAGSRMSVLSLSALVVMSLLISRRNTNAGARRASKFLGTAAFLGMVLQLGIGSLHDAVGLEITIANSGERIRSLGNGDGSLLQRLFLWREGLTIFATQPLWGVGMGNLGWALFASGADAASVGLLPRERNAHNILIQFLAEGGIIATTIVLSGVGWWALNIFRQRRELGDEVWLFVLAGSIVIGVHSMLEFPLWHVPVLGVVAFMAGFAVPNRIDFSSPRLLRGVIGTLSAVGVAFTVSAVQSYSQIQSWLHPNPFSASITPSSLGRSIENVLPLADSPFGPFIEMGNALYLELDDRNLDFRRDLVERTVRFAPIPETVMLRPLLDARAGDMAAFSISAMQALRAYPEKEARMLVLLDGFVAEDKVRFEPYSLAFAEISERVASRRRTTALNALAR